MLELYRDNELEHDVAPHVVDTLTSCRIVDVAILQAAQVVLIGTVQQVLGRHVDLCHFSLVNVQVCSCRQTEQRIARCACLGIIHLIIMVLREVALQPQGHEGVVKDRVTVMRQFVFKF